MLGTEWANRELRRVLKFTEADLAANRQGQLTRPQLFHLIKRTTGYLFMAGVIVMTVLGLTYGLKYLWVILGYYALLFLMMVPWLAFLRRKVDVVEGKLTKYKMPTGDPREPETNYVKVSGLGFLVPEDVFDCFADGLNYRVFYTSTGELMVAAELVVATDHAE